MGGMIYKKREVLETVLRVIHEGSLCAWQVAGICKERYGWSENTVLKSISRLHTMGKIRTENSFNSHNKKGKLYIITSRL